MKPFPVLSRIWIAVAVVGLCGRVSAQTTLTWTGGGGDH